MKRELIERSVKILAEFHKNEIDQACKHARQWREDVIREFPHIEPLGGFSPYERQIADEHTISIRPHLPLLMSATHSYPDMVTGIVAELVVLRHRLQHRNPRRKTGPKAKNSEPLVQKAREKLQANSDMSASQAARLTVEECGKGEHASKEAAIHYIRHQV